MIHRIVVERGSAHLRGLKAPIYAYSACPGHEGRSHQPFLDGCRVLLAQGVEPGDHAMLVWSDGIESMSGTVGVAAGLMVAEADSGTRFTPFTEWAGTPHVLGLDASDETTR